MSRQNHRSGSDRNEEHRKSHTYVDVEGNLYPMCGYGWNRSNGDEYSIFRGMWGSEGTCELCRKNLAAGKKPIMDGWPHKTKWL